MNKLPISLCLFTSSKGHFGRKTDWKITLDHWDKQIPLSLFNLIAHIKVSPSELELGEQMAAELQQRGFHVIKTVADWSRGLSHGFQYLSDMITVSKEPAVYKRPFFLLLEDDSPAISHQVPLEQVLLTSCNMLEHNHEMLTARLMRRGDDRGPIEIHPSPDARYLWSQHTNFQPLLMRSLDFYRLCLALEANPQACQQVQCEMLWRLILQNFSRSPFKHLVWEPEFAETVHIGVNEPDHTKALQLLKK